MKQEDRELLLKDLSARLPYGVIIEGLEHPEIMTIKHLAIISVMTTEPYKPYLRSMSSMTKEEEKEYNSFIIGQQPLDCDFSAYPIEYKILYEDDIDSYIDWLNAHHFDYRGLIEKRLAIAVTEKNNPYKS